LFGGIVFGPDFEYPEDPKSGQLPALDYKIRFSKGKTSTDTKFLFPFFQLSGAGESGL
jgi:hypothetical protein